MCTLYLSRKREAGDPPCISFLGGWWRQQPFPLGLQNPPRKMQGFWLSKQGHTLFAQTLPGRSSSNILDRGLPAEFLEHVPMNNKQRACPAGNQHTEKPTSWNDTSHCFYQTGHMYKAMHHPGKSLMSWVITAKPTYDVFGHLKGGIKHRKNSIS